MWYLAAGALAAYSLVVFVDEAWFHRRRGLPRWERWGHPADTLTVLLCYAVVLRLPPAPGPFAGYVGLAVFSSLFVTKDEWVHARHCGAGEMWLHALLFLLHPVVLALAGAWWKLAAQAPAAPGLDFFGRLLAGQAGLTVLFLAYQLIYWNLIWKESPSTPLLGVREA